MSPLKSQVGGDHYSKLKIQPLEYCHANNIPKIEGDVIAYVTRWRDKGGIQDLKKAIHELEILVALEEAKTSPITTPETSDESIHATQEGNGSDEIPFPPAPRKRSRAGSRKTRGKVETRATKATRKGKRR